MKTGLLSIHAIYLLSKSFSRSGQDYPHFRFRKVQARSCIFRQTQWTTDKIRAGPKGIRSGMKTPTVDCPGGVGWDQKWAASGRVQSLHLSSPHIGAPRRPSRAHWLPSAFSLPARSPRRSGRLAKGQGCHRRWPGALRPGRHVGDVGSRGG